jgi:nitroreductase
MGVFMNNLSLHSEDTLREFMRVIYGRRSIRNYTPEIIDSELIELLLNAAIQAPTAMHEEPCAFVIIQDTQILKSLSEEIKISIRKQMVSGNPISGHILQSAQDASFNVFYNASTLILICSQFSNKFTSADCWLATENLLLTASANQLGGCVIGLSIDTVNTKKWKDLLNIPTGAEVISAVILGIPKEAPPASARKPVKILSWKSLALNK